MNPETELKRICKENKGKFEHEDFKTGGENGSFVHISKYKLKIPHRDFIMNILYDFGNSDTAEFKIHTSGNKKSLNLK
ncbi:hypothetical protein SCB49_11407 [unidentified eubacterium SCB49]|nr:hypothetical protein SCB49_11407 [unidentified eubacterium SCB49]